MPKKFNVAVYDKKKLALLRKRAKRVEQLYTLAVHNASRIATQTSYKGEGDFFFDDYPSAKTEIDNMLQELAQALETNITEGNNESWKLATSKNDAMVDSLTKGTGIPKKTIKEWKHPNLEALQAFNNRVVAGMGLSDRVWNLTKQLKAELELAMEVGIGEGKSAADLSRDVRKYLREPNKLFRRVRDKSGTLRLSKAARAYHPGRGVYRSSYKNALRMTATENNIAYRTCDHERWKQMPFILGIDIHTSNNHPQDDICDDLEGRYPKDFKFTGWHPWCRCQATAALPTEAEFIKYGKAILNGSDQNFKFEDTQDKVPEKFKNWVTKNKTRIADAKAMPYFLKDNPQYLEQAGYKIPASQKDMFVDIKTGEDKPLTTLEKAKLRQAARTQGQIDDIKKRAAEREERLKEQDELIQKAFEAGMKMPEVSISELTKAINKGEMNHTVAIAKKVQAEVKSMEAAENKLTDLIPNAHELHKTYTIKELQAAHDAIERTFNRWTWDFTTDTSLQFLKRKLETEISIVASKSYKTKDIAKKAFEDRLALVNKHIELKSVKDSLSHEFEFVKHTRSSIVRNLAKDIQASLNDTSTDIAVLRTKADELKDKVRKLEARAKAKKAGVKVQTEAEIKRDVIDAFAKRGEKITEGEINVEDGMVLLSIKQHETLAYKFMKVSEQEKNLIYARRGGNYVGTSRSFQLNGALRDVYGGGKHAIIGDIDKSPNLHIGRDRDGVALKPGYIDTIKALDKAIARNKTEFPILMIRNLDFNGINPFFGGRLHVLGHGKVSEQITKLGQKNMISDPAFMSASSDATKNYFKERKYQLQLELPKGTPMFVTDNTMESEGILGRSTKLVFKWAKEKNIKGDLITIVRCVVQP